MAKIQIKVFNSSLEIVGSTWLESDISFDMEIRVPGTFQIELSTEAPGAAEFLIDRIILIDDAEQFAGLITDVRLKVSSSGTFFVIRGRELKYILSFRNILPLGYAPPVSPVSQIRDIGTTEFLCKKYVRENCVSSRPISLLSVTPNLDRGVDTAYSPRNTNLVTALNDLTLAANMGYNVAFDPLAKTMKFDMIAGNDRTIDQDVNKRVVFSCLYNNLVEGEYLQDGINYKNAFYGEKEGTENIYTYERDGTPSGGIGRKEQNITIESESEVYGDILPLMVGMAGEYYDVESFSAKVLNFREVFGRDYFVGDTVSMRFDYRVFDRLADDGRTVLYKNQSVIFNKQISKASIKYSAGKKDVTITFGVPPRHIKRVLRNDIKFIK